MKIKKTWFSVLTAIGMSIPLVLFAYSIEWFNLESIQQGLTGYAFGTYDNYRYIHMPPCYTNLTTGKIHGKVARFDTNYTLNDPNGWQTFDLTQNGHPDSKGFHGSVKAGLYMYFAPLFKSLNPYVLNGTITRYKLNRPFNQGTSWEHYDISTHSGIVAAGLSDKAKGFVGCVFDSVWVYFVPYGGGDSGLVVRFNALSDLPLYDESAWEWFNLTTKDPSLKGFHLGGMNGRLYLAQHSDMYGQTHGKIVRYTPGLVFNPETCVIFKNMIEKAPFVNKKNQFKVIILTYLFVRLRLW